MKLIINDNIFKCRVCNSVDSIKEGMMNKTFQGFDSMLFLMPEKKRQSFWMYNCLIPLDIVMVDGNVITKIHSNCKPCDDQYSCKSYTGFGDKVVELPGGTCKKLGIKEGDIVRTSLF